MPYKNYVLRHQPENYTSPGCVQYPAETAEHLLANQKSYFAEHGPEFHFGSPQSHWIARLSPFNYSAFGLFLCERKLCKVSASLFCYAKI